MADGAFQPYVAARKDFAVTRGCDYPITLRFKDKTGTAINITSWTITLVANNSAGEVKIAKTFTIAVGTDGVATSKLSRTETAAETEAELHAKIYVEPPGGDKRVAIEGDMTFDPEKPVP